MRKLSIFFVLVLTMQMAGLSIAANHTPVIAVVVASNPSGERLKLGADSLKLVYWRKQRYWPIGLPIKPVNLKAKHPLRDYFSQIVLGSKPDAQIDYWNGQYFNGVLPPHTVESEEAVIRYVEKTKGAIGYVNACNVDQRVTPLFWIKNGQLSHKKLDFLCDHQD